MRVDKVTQTYITDQLQETDSALELCASKENLAKWIANEKNQFIFIEKINSQIIEGDLDFSDEISRMVKDLQISMKKWSTTFADEKENICWGNSSNKTFFTRL